MDINRAEGNDVPVEGAQSTSTIWRQVERVGGWIGSAAATFGLLAIIGLLLRYAIPLLIPCCVACCRRQRANVERGNIELDHLGQRSSPQRVPRRRHSLDGLHPLAESSPLCLAEPRLRRSNTTRYV